MDHLLPGIADTAQVRPGPGLGGGVPAGGKEVDGRLLQGQGLGVVLGHIGGLEVPAGQQRGRDLPKEGGLPRPVRAQDAHLLPAHDPQADVLCEEPVSGQQFLQAQVQHRLPRR